MIKNQAQSARLPKLTTGLFSTVNASGRLLRSAGLPVTELSEEHLFRVAQRKVKLSDFGSDYFRTPFRIWLLACQEEGRMSTVGRTVFKRRALRGLINRLLITNELRQHPEILETPIRRPIVIVSLPRTGTTLLHRLLSLDPRARPLLAWEGFMPARRPSELSKSYDPRLKRARQIQRIFDAIKWLLPSVKTIHHLDAYAPEECTLLLENTFVSCIFHLPSYRKWYLEQPLDTILASYRDYYQQLQLVQWLRPHGDHWVLKAPAHLYGITALLQLMPDATIVQLHRDPLKVMPSVCSLGAAVSPLFTDDPEQYERMPSYLLSWAAEGIRRAEESRLQAAPERFFDVHYVRLVSDPIGTIRDLYDHLDYEFSDEFETRVHQWLEANPRDKFGKHRYSLEEFSITENMIAEAFGSYCSRYGIEPENP